VAKVSVPTLLLVLLSGMELVVTLLVTVAPLVSTGTLTVMLVLPFGGRLKLTTVGLPLMVTVAVKVAVALPRLVKVTVPVTVVPAGAFGGRSTLVVKSGCNPLKVAVAVLLVRVLSGRLLTPTPAVTVLPPAWTVSTGAATVVLWPGFKVMLLVPGTTVPLTL
jgi:hypothetical protein